MPSKTVVLGLLAAGMAYGAVLGVAADRNSEAIIGSVADAKDPVVALLDQAASRAKAPAGHVMVRIERGFDARGFAIVDVVVPVSDRVQCDIAVGEGIRNGASMAPGEAAPDPCDRPFPSEVRLRQTPGTDL